MTSDLRSGAHHVPIRVDHEPIHLANPIPTRSTSRRSESIDYTVQPIAFLGRIVVLILLMAIGIAGTIIVPGAAKLPFQFLIALMLAHATELVHQCLHKLATGNSKIDRLLGTSLGLPVFVSHTFYQFGHLFHHRWNGMSQDRESFGYTYQLMEFDNRLIRLFGFVFHLTMLSHFFDAFRRMLGSYTGALANQLAKDGIPATPAIRIVAEYRFMAVATVLAITAGIVFSANFLIYIWLVPLMIWAPIHALIELPEHVLCDRPNGDTRANTRSIKAGWFMKWLTNFNCNHVGHHWNMKIPMNKLPAFEAELQANHEFAHIDESYAAFYMRFLKSLWIGPRQTDNDSTPSNKS